MKKIVTEQTIGLIIPLYNRYEITKICLEKLKETDINNYKIVIIDDYSNDINIINYCNSYQHNNSTNQIFVYHNNSNLGIAKTIKFGFDKLLELNCDIFINLDSVALVNIDTFTVLLILYNKINNKRRYIPVSIKNLIPNQ